jgi:hypothetical protein
VQPTSYESGDDGNEENDGVLNLMAGAIKNRAVWGWSM